MPHQHKHRPKVNEYRDSYRHRRLERIMEQAERMAREAPKKAIRRPRMPREEQDW